MSNTVIGIDPSLTSLGFAYRKGDKALAYCVSGGTRRGIRRIAYIRDAVSEALDRYNPSLVAFEGYALGFRGKSNIIFDLGELGGVLKLLILEKGIDILLVPPTSLKLFATGKGNADKEKVSLAVGSMLGVTFSTSDQYDAAGLMLMGEMFYSMRSRVALRGRGGLLPHRKQAVEACTLIEAF